VANVIKPLEHPVALPLCYIQTVSSVFHSHLHRAVLYSYTVSDSSYGMTPRLTT